MEPLQGLIRSIRDRFEVVYEVCIHKTYMGVWRDSVNRGKAHRHIWSQWTEAAEKKESNSGGYRETESMEKRKGSPQADQVEFRKA